MKYKNESTKSVSYKYNGDMYTIGPGVEADVCSGVKASVISNLCLVPVVEAPVVKAPKVVVKEPVVEAKPKVTEKKPKKKGLFKKK